MTLKDFFEKFEEYSIDEGITKIIETEYGCLLTEEVKKVISFANDGYFFDDEDLYRLLSIEEIIHATEHLHVEFKNYFLIPIIDNGENNFISFDYSKNCWCKFNIVDETKFKVKDSILQYTKV